MKKFTIKIDIDKAASGTVTDFLSDRSGLAKSRVKDAMNKGAGWLKDRKGKLRRLRKASYSLNKGDHLEFYYNERLLSAKPPDIQCLHDAGHYSVWDKPAGLMSQGTKYGDHCSLMRQAELFFSPNRKVFLLHRLDREASGVMLLAHSRKAASALSELFRINQITKEYQIVVAGHLSEENPGRIDLPLDGKPALTEFEVMSYDSKSNSSTVKAFIKTGRFHQIRRHFDMIGHPVLGDPKYGRGNKNIEGMKLSAAALKFRCPFSKKDVEFRASHL
jgi:tRNA pseudouridine32 synthase/23S rRNA pseudouridine746 synthase